MNNLSFVPTQLDQRPEGVSIVAGHTMSAVLVRHIATKIGVDYVLNDMVLPGTVIKIDAPTYWMTIADLRHTFGAAHHSQVECINAPNQTYDSDHDYKY